MINNPTQKAYAAAVLYALIIGFSFVFVKYALVIAHPLDLLAHRFTLSFVGTAIIILISPARQRFTLKDIMRLLPLAIFFPSLYFAFQAFGLLYIPSTEAGIIQALIPVMTMVLASYWIKEVSTGWQKIGIALSVLGVIYISLMKGVHVNDAALKGSLLILLSSLSFAVYNVFVRKLAGQYRGIDMAFIMMLISSIVFNALSVGRHVIEGTLPTFFDPFKDARFVLSIVYLSVLSSLATSLLMNYAIKHLEASKMSVFVNFATLVTVIAGVLVLGEQLLFAHIIGGVIILAGVIIVNATGKRNR